MAGQPKPTAIVAFEDNLADAESILGLVKALRNGRQYRMRRELREKVGSALKVPTRDRDALDCIESEDVFVVLKAGSSLSRAQFTDSAMEPLLRQVFVIVCAAIETYGADRTMELLKGRLTEGKAPKDLGRLRLAVVDVLHVEANYQRRKVGHRKLIESEVRRLAGPSPGDLADVLKLAGISDLWNSVDHKRGLGQGTSRTELGAIVERRNRIAHTGDRDGRGRGHVTLEEAEIAAGTASDIVSTVHAVTQDPLLS